jgi:hypothetical protein
MPNHLNQLLALLEISALAHRLFNYDLKVERADRLLAT